MVCFHFSRRHGGGLLFTNRRILSLKNETGNGVGGRPILISVTLEEASHHPWLPSSTTS